MFDTTKLILKKIKEANRKMFRIKPDRDVIKDLEDTPELIVVAIPVVVFYTGFKIVSISVYNISAVIVLTGYGVFSVFENTFKLLTC